VSLLSVSDLDVFYGRSQVVDGVDFDVDPNRVVSIIGPNGAGKSTIMDSIFNYTKWEGEIRFDGQDLRGMAAHEIASLGISYCMEEHNLFPYMTVGNNLLTAAHDHQGNVEANLDDVFDLFPKLEERQGQEARTLSGGEQQMLAIGKALMADPKLLIVDEPTLGLAPIVIDDISEAVRRLREEVTILLVEQNVTFGFEHADEIILIETGEIVASGPPEDLQDDEYVQEVYLGLPGTT